MLAAIWSTPLRKMITTVTAVFAFIAALGGAIKAGPDIEPYVAATRGYVRDHVKLAGDPTLQVLKAIQIEQAQGKREQAEDNIDSWTVKLPKATDDNERLTIQRSLRRAQETKDKLDVQIKTLQMK